MTVALDVAQVAIYLVGAALGIGLLATLFRDRRR
jgi:hypothetical protein